MINIVYNIENLDLSSIRIKKPYTHGEYQIFDVYYNDGPFLIQTPVAYLSDTYILIENRSFQMDIIYHDKNFSILLDNICDFILEKINNYSNKLYSEKIKIYQIINDEQFKLMLKTYNYDTIKVFNYDKLIINMQNLSKDDRVKVIFQFEKLITNESSSCFFLKIYQILKLNSKDDMMLLNDKFLFVQDISNFDKYDKMKQIGIPILAIYQKMKIDGLTKDEINNFINQDYKLGYHSTFITPSLSNKCSPIPPPLPGKKPPIPPPLPGKKPPIPPPLPGKIPPILPINKVTIPERKFQEEKPSLKNGPPSLSDIINAKNKLKKFIAK